MSHALCAFAEPFVDGKRVLLICDATAGIQERLVTMGARLVHVYDPDTDRVSAAAPEAPKGTQVRTLPESDFEVRDGAFDLALVPELTIVESPSVWLSRLRRVVGAEGVVIAGGENVDYYELYDAMSLQFANVRMVAQVPFAGLTFTETGSEETDADVSVDTQLVEGDAQPSAFFAVASEDELPPLAYTIVQLSNTDDQPQSLVFVRPKEDAVQPSRVTESDSDRSLLRAELTAARDENAVVRQRQAALEEGVSLAEQTIIVLRDRLAELESTLRDRDAIAAALDSTLREREMEVATLQHQAAQPRMDTQLTAQLEVAQEEHERDVKALEERLAERGTKVATLEEELRRRERMIVDLTSRLNEAPDTSALDELRRKLDALALKAARQESELQASQWRITELASKEAVATSE